MSLKEGELGEDELKDVSGGMLTFIMPLVIGIVVNAAFVGYAFTKSRTRW